MQRIAQTMKHPYIHPWLIPLLNLGKPMFKCDPNVINNRRTDECRHPPAGNEPNHTTQFWCTECKVVYNMGELDCTDAEMTELFKGWLIVETKAGK